MDWRDVGGGMPNVDNDARIPRVRVTASNHHPQLSYFCAGGYRTLPLIITLALPISNTNWIQEENHVTTKA